MNSVITIIEREYRKEGRTKEGKGGGRRRRRRVEGMGEKESILLKLVEGHSSKTLNDGLPPLLCKQLFPPAPT